MNIILYTLRTYNVWINLKHKMFVNDHKLRIFQNKNKNRVGLFFQRPPNNNLFCYYKTNSLIHCPDKE